MVATHEHWKDKRDQKDTSSTACETVHTKEKVDVQNKREYESHWKRVPDLRSGMLEGSIGSLAA